MLTSLGFAGLLGILGTFVAVLWTLVLAAGGMPGAALTTAGTRAAKPALITVGTVVSFLVESYLLLTFAGLVVRFVGGFVELRPHLPAWPLWLVGWYLATAPVLFGGWHAPGAKARDQRDVASTLALALAAAAYWVFVFWPRILTAGWPWLPAVAI